MEVGEELREGITNAHVQKHNKLVHNFNVVTPLSIIVLVTYKAASVRLLFNTSVSALQRGWLSN